MLEENVRQWTREWLDQGRVQGIEQGRTEGIGQGRHEERALLCRLAARYAEFRIGRGSSMSVPPRGWPPPSRASPTPNASRRSATGSSSAGRRPTCSPASAATVLGRVKGVGTGVAAARQRRQGGGLLIEFAVPHPAFAGPPNSSSYPLRGPVATARWWPLTSNSL